MNSTSTKLDLARQFMDRHNLDAFYVSSFDAYLSEYTPKDDNHRLALTAFTGSTAESLLVKNQRMKVYVDGRYYEQVDREVDPKLVEAIKPDVDKVGMFQSVCLDLQQLIAASKRKVRLGIEGDRTPVSYATRLRELDLEVVSFNKKEFEREVGFKGFQSQAPIEILPKSKAGTSVGEKLGRIFAEVKHPETSAYFTTQMDMLSWVCNARAYQMPFQSSVIGRALITNQKAYVFVPSHSVLGPSCGHEDKVEFVKVDYENLEDYLAKLQNKLRLKKIFFTPGAISLADLELLQGVFGEGSLESQEMGLVRFASLKEPNELKLIESSFDRSNKAIFNTLSWMMKEVADGKKVSERQLYEKTSHFYNEQGAKGQSFNTIAGIGANASVIHYGSASPAVFAKKNDIVLLDSGGYFESGHATDTTRTFLAGGSAGKASAKQKEIYTLTLKGLVQLSLCVFPEGTLGNALDYATRRPLYERGYDYKHGTGHGVGIHVHEGGVRISSVSRLPMKYGQFVSMEPGIYIPGFGGVRLENIGFVDHHPKHKGMLYLRPVVFIGFDHNLIDLNILDGSEIRYIMEYEEECRKRKTSFIL